MLGIDFAAKMIAREFEEPRLYVLHAKKPDRTKQIDLRLIVLDQRRCVSEARLVGCVLGLKHVDQKACASQEILLRQSQRLFGRLYLLPSDRHGLLGKHARLMGHQSMKRTSKSSVTNISIISSNRTIER
nr:hypothetical protein [Methylocystis iwaonis]